MISEQDAMHIWGFAKTEGLKHIVNILNIIGDDYDIIDGVLVYSDIVKGRIDKEQDKLKKPFYSFKNKMFHNAMPRSLYNKTTNHQTRDEQLEFIKTMRKRHGTRWRTYEWAKNYIGEFDRWDNSFEYYWNLIGNDWRRDSEGNILLSRGVCQEILEDSRFGEGRDFLKSHFWSRKKLRGFVGTY